MAHVFINVRQRRKAKRQSVYSYVGIYHIASQEFLGHLSNRSETGFMVTSIKPFEVQQSYQLAMHFHNKEETVLHPVEAQCLWVRKERHTVFFNAGFKITSLQSAMTATR